jgi:DNA topoisomerase I
LIWFEKTVPKLLIVESPGKIKKLKSILGAGWDVKASVGHIRQLSNEGEDALGFTIGNGKLDCHYIARDPRAQQTIAGLKAAAKQASEVVLASDPDREGETIAWHVAQVLGLKNPKRVVYQEITEAAVRSAIAQPRNLDMDLVAAGRCRDCLDKLVGYKGSPLVWRLNNGAKSVGRVQSATLHLLCQRERAIQAFLPQDYWSVFVDYAEGFRAYFYGDLQGPPPTTAADTPADTADETQGDAGSSDDASSANNSRESTRVLSAAEAERLVSVAREQPHRVVSVAGKVSPKKPPPPFTTSSLQQAAGSRLRFSPEYTMQIAQKLYEAGHITYMRTDSVQLSPEYCEAAKQWLQTHDPANIPAKTSQQRNRKTAQEAHEAIRPTDVLKASATLKQQLSEDEFKLYVLIWMRAMASQCKPAQLRKTQILTQSGTVQWQAKGQVVEFAGYSRYWQDISADSVLPQLQPAQPLTLVATDHEQKQTQPPPRYTEPKLVQLLERCGIGRPSTYAPTIATLKERAYAVLDKSKLVPTELGLQVDDFLGKALPDLLESEFTAQMEASLDAIASGQQDWQQYLIGWNHDYFAPALSKALQDLPAPTRQYAPRQLEKSRSRCPSCQQALFKVPTKKLKKGYFLKCETCKAEAGKDLVLFWSEHTKQWQLPQSKPPTDIDTLVPPSQPQLSKFPCPVCQKPLEVYRYQKEGQPKQMLRCSDPEARAKPKHKDVAYFHTKEGKWWSPKLGELLAEV